MLQECRRLFPYVLQREECLNSLGNIIGILYMTSTACKSALQNLFII